jgi:hypothetical protein
MFMVKTACPRLSTPEFMKAANNLVNREIKAGRLIDVGGLTRFWRLSQTPEREASRRRPAQAIIDR